MAMVCDACNTKYGRDDGSASLHVSPPTPDFKAFVAAGIMYERHDPLTLDLCRSCTAKTLAHLGLPTAVCDLPIVPSMTSEDRPNAGALTEEDLRKLGLVDANGVRPKS